MRPARGRTCAPRVCYSRRNCGISRCRPTRMGGNEEMRLQFAERCAWRALYLYRADGRQVLRLGVDPHDGVRPALFGAVGRWSLRLTLPYVPWRWVMATRYARPVALLYRASMRFWLGVDGRYGWGRSKRP